jgi:hypothetical protein
MKIISIAIGIVILLSVSLIILASSCREAEPPVVEENKVPPIDANKPAVTETAIPPIDANKPIVTETATFSLG